MVTGPGTVVDAVREALAGRDDWLARAALALAVSADEGSPSAVRELRALMAQIADSTPATEGGPLDDLIARREARRAGGGAAAKDLVDPAVSVKRGPGGGRPSR